MLSMLGKIFSRQHFETFFFVFLTREFDISCIMSPVRQLASNANLFSGKIRKISVCHLLNLPRVEMANFEFSVTVVFKCLTHKVFITTAEDNVWIFIL